MGSDRPPKRTDRQRLGESFHPDFSLKLPIPASLPRTPTGQMCKWATGRKVLWGGRENRGELGLRLDFLWVPRFRVFSIGYTDSRRLLPLAGDGAGLNFLHIFAQSQGSWVARMH